MTVQNTGGRSVSLTLSYYAALTRPNSFARPLVPTSDHFRPKIGDDTLNSFVAPLRTSTCATLIPPRVDFQQKDPDNVQQALREIFPNKSRAEIREVLLKIGKAFEDVFGEKRYGRMMRLAITKDISILFDDIDDSAKGEAANRLKAVMKKIGGDRPEVSLCRLDDKLLQGLYGIFYSGTWVSPKKIADEERSLTSQLSSTQGLTPLEVLEKLRDKVNSPPPIWNFSWFRRDLREKVTQALNLRIQWAYEPEDSRQMKRGFDDLREVLSFFPADSCADISEKNFRDIYCVLFPRVPLRSSAAFVQDEVKSCVQITETVDSYLLRVAGLIRQIDYESEKSVRDLRIRLAQLFYCEVGKAHLDDSREVREEALKNVLKVVKGVHGLVIQKEPIPDEMIPGIYRWLLDTELMPLEELR